MIEARHILATAPLVRTEEEAGRIARVLESVRAAAGVETTAQAAMFIAQLGFESAGFRALTEPSGAAYEGRKDLGNTEPGDGDRYKGRGWIQLTGRDNYRRAGKALGIDLEGRPELAAGMQAAAAIAAWYWREHQLADQAHADDLPWVTRRINGGMNGIEIRRRYYRRARKAFGLEDLP